MDDLYRDQQLEALGNKQNYCPLGCTLEDLDERGYCQHLVGFTNDGKVVETIQPVLRKNPETKEMEPTGDTFVSGNKKKGHLDAVKPGDVLVNPTEPQTVKGLTHIKKAWVSARVYRQAQESPVEPDESAGQKRTKMAKAS